MSACLFVQRPLDFLFSRFLSFQWLDPNEVSEISMANSRQNVRKLVKDGFVLRKPNVIHSRSRVQRRLEAKAKGRHTGFGKRRGARDARLPVKVVFMRRLRILRRMIRKYRDAQKIDKHTYVEWMDGCMDARFRDGGVGHASVNTMHSTVAVWNEVVRFDLTCLLLHLSLFSSRPTDSWVRYHRLYLACKGNKYKTKKQLMEAVHKMKAEKAAEKALKDLAEQKKARAKAARARKEDKASQNLAGAQ